MFTTISCSSLDSVTSQRLYNKLMCDVKFPGQKVSVSDIGEHGSSPFLLMMPLGLSIFIKCLKSFLSSFLKIQFKKHSLEVLCVHVVDGASRETK